MNQVLRWLSSALAFVDAHNGAVTAIATVCIAALTVVLALVTRGQMRLAHDAIRLARDEFSAQHRPWIAIRNMQVNGPIMVNEDGFIVPVEFTVENTGTTPATDFLMYCDAHSQRQEFSVEETLARLIETYDANKRNIKRLQAEVIFPQGEITRNELIAVSEIDIKGMQNSKTMLLFSPIIIGAFFYRSPFDTTNRYTTFVYTISGNRLWLRSDEEEDWPDIQADEVRVNKWHVGWTAT